MKKINFLFLGVLILIVGSLLIGSLINPKNHTENDSSNNISKDFNNVSENNNVSEKDENFIGGGGGMPNPASVYCGEAGYTSETRTSEDGGQHGVCIFPDGSECSEWSYYCTCINSIDCIGQYEKCYYKCGKE